MLQRAARAAYTDNTLRELLKEWRQMAFRERSSGWCLLPEYREPVALRLGDIRYQAPPGSFDLVLCRNLAFTYFDLKTQERVLSLFREHLVEGGALVLGRHETLPPSALSQFHHWLPSLPIYRHVGVETRCLRR